MKILKPGKVEMRKFVCSDCGCVFVARKTEMLWTIYGSCKCCPTCYKSHEWDNGEPYEEPTPTQTLDEVQKLMKVIEEFKGDLSRIDYSNVALIRFCKHLIANGVTFREVQADE